MKEENRGGREGSVPSASNQFLPGGGWGRVAGGPRFFRKDSSDINECPRHRKNAEHHPNKLNRGGGGGGGGGGRGGEGTVEILRSQLEKHLIDSLKDASNSVQDCRANEILSGSFDKFANFSSILCPPISPPLQKKIVTMKRTKRKGEEEEKKMSLDLFDIFVDLLLLFV